MRPLLLMPAPRLRRFSASLQYLYRDLHSHCLLKAIIISVRNAFSSSISFLLFTIPGHRHTRTHSLATLASSPSPLSSSSSSAASATAPPGPRRRISTTTATTSICSAAAAASTSTAATASSSSLKIPPEELMRVGAALEGDLHRGKGQRKIRVQRGGHREEEGRPETGKESQGLAKERREVGKVWGESDAGSV